MADRDLRGRTLGGYVLLEKIGKGGYGDVYRGVQPLLEREVVVKVLREHQQIDELARERFLREAQLASRLDHPYAAHIYDFGVEAADGLLWIAMELVDGISLDDWLETYGPMPLDQLVPFFKCVAQVVQASHDHGVIHRDLKPSNVMVVEHRGHLSPKLLDFGIAKLNDEIALAPPETWPAGPLVEPRERGDRGDTSGPDTNPDPVIRALAGAPRLTRPGVGIGSSEYMSPEQWSNAGTVGPASDIYSLGVVLYEALTGRVPFTAETTDECYRLHRDAAVPSLGGELSPELDRILRRALAKSPGARHGTALELAAELQTALRAEPREQLRSSAQQWEDKARARGLLWSAGRLADFERRKRRASLGPLSEGECAFLVESQRRARRVVWGWRLLVALVVVGVFGAFQDHAATQTRHAQDQARHAQDQARMAEQQARFAEQLVTQAEVEQGRQALHEDAAEARRLLAAAYRGGDHSPGVVFMFVRSLEPLLAELARFPSTSGRMWSARYSPDGQRIVTTDDRGAQVWDAVSYRRLFTLAHGDAVYDATYSEDGTRLVTAAGDGAVRIWDAVNGSLVRTLSHRGRRLRYGLVAMSPDGKLVAAVDVDGEAVHVWDAGTGVPLAALRCDASGFPGLEFSADGRWLAATGGNGVRVFATWTWTSALTIPHVRRLSFDPTGPRLVTGSTSGDASIWAIPSGARIRHLREIGESIDRVAFSPDGKLLVTASGDGAEQIWNAASGALQSQLNPRHSKILAVEFDRASRLVLAAGADGSVVVADAALGTPVAVLEGPQNIVRVAHFAPSTRRVVGASWDGTARVWDATAPHLRWGSPPVSTDCGSGTEPDRRFVAIGCRDHPTRIWDTARDQLLAELPSVTHVDGDWASASPAVSAAGDLAAIARGNTVAIYELPGGRLLRTIAHGAAVNTVAFAAAGHDLVSGDVAGDLWITRDGHEPIALPRSSGGIDAVGFLPGGRVVSVDAGRRLRIYDLDRGAVLADLEAPTRGTSLRPSLDGTRLITVLNGIPSYVGKAAPPVLWDVEHYRVIASLEGHRGQVFSARFVAGDREIVTAGGDGTARLWDGATGQPRQTYHGSSRLLADATLTPDGTMVVAGGGDGVLRFWDATGGRSLWTMTAHKSPIMGIHWEGDSLVTRGFSGEVSRWELPKLERVIEACGTPCGIIPRNEESPPAQARRSP